MTERLSGLMIVKTVAHFFLSFTILSALFGALPSVAKAAATLPFEAMPGSTWGRLTRDVDGDIEGNGVMGFVNQGVDWHTFPGDVTFNTFAEYRYRIRDKNKTFYNANGPALGFEFRKSFLHLGMDYYWERFPELSQTSDKVQYYLSGYYGWDLKKLPHLEVPVQGLSGWTWNRLSYDVDGLVGAGGIGNVNQGIDWTTLPWGVVFNTYAEFSYRFRDKNNSFYNAYGPALGGEFKKRGVSLGATYFWQRFPELHQNSNRLQFYSTYYFDWDLKKGIPVAR